MVCHVCWSHECGLCAGMAGHSTGWSVMCAGLMNVVCVCWSHECGLCAGMAGHSTGWSVMCAGLMNVVCALVWLVTPQDGLSCVLVS